MTLRRLKPKIRWSTFVPGLLGVLVLQLFPEPLRGQIAIWAGVSFVGLLIAALILCIIIGIVRRIRWAMAPFVPPAQFAWQNSVEDRLDELERLKRRDMVTPEEYAAKRQEIIKDL